MEHTTTYRETLPTRTALLISVGLIVVRWSVKVVSNVRSLDTAAERLGSMQQLALSALASAAFTVVAVTLLLWLSRETYLGLGFRRDNVLKQLGIGAGLGVLVFVLDTFLLGPLADTLLPKTSAQGIDMSRLFSKLSYLPIWIAMALLKGGFVEELWRIFALTRFKKSFGTAGLVFALIASSIVFGFGHLYQGTGAVVTNAIEGLLYALIYLRKRSAWEPVFAHAMFDLIGVILGFVVYA
jgi:membrane protease YdiL (CAAX protease family)